MHVLYTLSIQKLVICYRIWNIGGCWVLISKYNQGSFKNVSCFHQGWDKFLQFHDFKGMLVSNKLLLTSACCCYARASIDRQLNNWHWNKNGKQFHLLLSHNLHVTVWIIPHCVIHPKSKKVGDNSFSAIRNWRKKCVNCHDIISRQKSINH